MDKAVFIKMNWHLRRQLNHLGWPGIMGLGLLAFSMMFYLSAIRPLESQLDDTRQQAQALGKYVQPAKPVDEASANPAEKLSGFYKFFPKTSSTPDWLAKIYSAAELQNLVLQQGEYRLVHDANGRLVHYEIFFPVKGDYVQIRKFLARIMSEIPYLSLDSISFQRQKIGDAVVESQIKLTLFLGEGS
jgi:hypothetical protein